MIIFEGVPHSLRPQIWMCMSGAYEKKRKSTSSYMEIIKASNNDQLVTSKQIEKDLTRILPSNYCFTSMNGTGIPRLRRILRGLAWLFPDIGYCQGTGVSETMTTALSYRRLIKICFLGHCRFFVVAVGGGRLLLVDCDDCRRSAASFLLFLDIARHSSRSTSLANIDIELFVAHR